MYGIGRVTSTRPPYCINVSRVNSYALEENARRRSRGKVLALEIVLSTTSGTHELEERVRSDKDEVEDHVQVQVKRRIAVARVSKRRQG